MKINPAFFIIIITTITLTRAQDTEPQRSNSLETKTVLHANETTIITTANITDLISVIKISVEFTAENYHENLKQLESSFTEIQDILDDHNTKIEDLLETTEQLLRTAVNETKNTKISSLFNAAINFIGFIPDVFTQRVNLSSDDGGNCRSLLHRMKQFEMLLTRLTHLRVAAINHVNILDNFIVDLHAAALMDSDDKMENMQKILDYFDLLKDEGESFEIDITVAIGLLQICVEKDDDLLKLADCIEGLPCGEIMVFGICHGFWNCGVNLKIFLSFLWFSGTFIRYDPINDPKAPKRNGFSAGSYEDKSEAYIGTGYTNVSLN
jgi:hypothetical protein